MPERTNWEETARRIVRAEMTRRGVSYQQLVEKLAAAGTKEDERNLRNKIARGKFPAAFMLECMAVMGARDIRLDHD